MKTKSKFFSLSELYGLTYQTWVKVLPKYIYFLAPILIIQVAYIFFFRIFPTAKEYHLLGTLIILPYAILFGGLHALLYALIFRDRNKRISYPKLYQEAYALLGRFVVEQVCFFLLIVGGFLLFFVPGIIFSIWFGYFGWLRIYLKDKKQFHFGASKTLVSDHEWKVFTATYIPYFLYFLFIIIVTNKLPNINLDFNVQLAKSLILFLIGSVFGSFFVTMRGLIFERLLNITPSPKSQEITGPVIISIFGWVFGWLFTGALIMVAVAALLPHNIKRKPLVSPSPVSLYAPVNAQK